MVKKTEAVAKVARRNFLNIDAERNNRQLHGASETRIETSAHIIGVVVPERLNGRCHRARGAHDCVGFI